MKNLVMTIDTLADDKGRVGFWLAWETAPRTEIVRGIPRTSTARGQRFRAVPDTYLKWVAENGGRVEKTP